MAEKIINTIITNRCDTLANWNASKYVPKEGEIILYSDENRIKIGDGVSLAKNLNYVSTETYTLSKSDNTITLVGSDGHTSSIADSSTTYVGGTGVNVSNGVISLKTSGAAAGTYGTSQQPEHAGTFTIPSLTIDAYGRVVKAETADITLPIDSDSDTKTSSSQSSSTKLYLLGAAEQKLTCVNSYSNSKCYIDTNCNLYSNSQKVLTSQTPVSINSSSTQSSTLTHNGTFSAITGLTASGHSVTPVLTTYTLPSGVIDDGEL